MVARFDRNVRLIKTRARHRFARQTTRGCVHARIRDDVRGLRVGDAGNQCAAVFTQILDRWPARIIIVIGSLIALTMMALHQSKDWMYIGISLPSAGTGLVLPIISFLAAGASTRTLGATTGGLATASGLDQPLGSVTDGWLFGVEGRIRMARFILAADAIFRAAPAFLVYALSWRHDTA